MFNKIFVEPIKQESPEIKKPPVGKLAKLFQFWRKGNGSKPGQGLVEFAMAVPVFLMVVFGVIEAGRLLFIISSVSTASREAARYGAAVNQFNDCSGIQGAATKMGFISGVANENITIRYDGGTGTLPAINCAATASQCPPSNLNLGDRIVVDVGVMYQPMIPITNFPGFCVQSQNAHTIVQKVEINGVAAIKPPAESVHVGDMDGSTSKVSSTWLAEANVQIHDSWHSRVQGATIEAVWEWEGGSFTPPSCTTAMDGRCDFVLETPLPSSVTVVNLRVTGVSGTALPYIDVDNHDVDTDSTGTLLILSSPW